MFDSFVIEKVCAGLTGRIAGRRVQRIAQLAKDRFAVKFGSQLYLILDISPQSYHISLSAEQPVDQTQPTGFYTGLRKHLDGARLVSVVQHDFDRTVEFRWANRNNVLEPVELSLYLEMMGRHGNAILVDQAGLIIQALKFSDSELHPIVMGEPYSRFGARRQDPFDSEEGLDQALNYKGFTKALLKLLPGFTRDMSLSQISHWLLEQDSPSLYLADDRYRDYHLFANDELALVETGDVFEAINCYYAQQPDQSKTSRLANYRQRINQRIKQLADKIALLQGTAREFAQADEWRHQADIIYANLYAIKRGQTEFQGFDFSGQPVTIELDRELTPSQNAQRLYEKYKKMTRGQATVEQQLALAETELAELEQLGYDLEQISRPAELAEMEHLLMERGLLKRPRRPAARSKASPLSVMYRDVQYTIGRNSYQNEQLISRIPHRNYVWFHAKGIPGSHVVMHLPIDQADDDHLDYGAKLAASYSKAGPGVKVAVDIVRLGQLKKPKGSAPGFVTFTGQQTVSVVGPERPETESK